MLRMIPSGWHFEFFADALFWIALAAVAALVRLVGGRPRLRAAVLLVSSAAMLLAVPQFAARDLLLVGVATLVTFTAGRALCRPARAEGDPLEAGGRRWIAAAGVGLVLGLLAFFKYPLVQDLLAGATGLPTASRYLSLLGVSYFSFRAIHVIVEAYKRTLGALEPLAFSSYMIFFPAFLSGPIHRYPQFAAQLGPGSAAPWKEDLAVGGRRILDGLFKKIVLVALVFPHVLPSKPEALAVLTPGAALVGLWAYALYFYFDFAGYSDLAIGSARLMGVQLPENFQWPFLQKNIRELWTNWHMSLTSWLVDYVYWPLVRRLRGLEWFRLRPVTLSAVGMTVTFVACGMWHGEALHFVVWGVYHGLGISAVTLYQRQKRRIRNPAVQRWFASPVSRWVGVVGTFNFFAVGLALFVLDMRQLGVLAGALLGAR